MLISIVFGCTAIVNQLNLLPTIRKTEMITDCKGLEQKYPSCADIEIWSKLTLKTMRCLVLLPIKTSGILIRPLSRQGVLFTDNQDIKAIKLLVKLENPLLQNRFYSLLVELQWELNYVQLQISTLLKLLNEDKSVFEFIASSFGDSTLKSILFVRVTTLLDCQFEFLMSYSVQYFYNSLSSFKKSNLSGTSIIKWIQHFVHYRSINSNNVVITDVFLNNLSYLKPMWVYLVIKELIDPLEEPIDPLESSSKLQLSVEDRINIIVVVAEIVTKYNTKNKRFDAALVHGIKTKHFNLIMYLLMVPKPYKIGNSRTFDMSVYESSMIENCPQDIKDLLYCVYSKELDCTGLYTLAISDPIHVKINSKWHKRYLDMGKSSKSIFDSQGRLTIARIGIKRPRADEGIAAEALLEMHQQLHRQIQD